MWRRALSTRPAQYLVGVLVDLDVHDALELVTVPADPVGAAMWGLTLLRVLRR